MSTEDHAVLAYVIIKATCCSGYINFSCRAPVLYARRPQKLPEVVNQASIFIGDLI